jgi:hypothetical protein
LGILRSIESRLERVVEGSVGRLFRASVAPVELARKLAKELEEGKVVSVTQTYAPNEYTIYLSPRDRTRFADFEASLRNELASYLAEHARRAGYVMPTRPRVSRRSPALARVMHASTVRVPHMPAHSVHVVHSLAVTAHPAAALDSAGSSTVPVVPVEPAPPVSDAVPASSSEPSDEPQEPVRSPLDPDPSGPPPGLAAFPLDPEPVAEVVPPPFVPPLPDVPPLPRDVPAVPSEPAPGVAPPLPFDPRPDETMIARPEPREELVLVHDDQRTMIDGPVVQIGRAPGCDIVLDDRNVSRRHAEIRRRGPVVVLIDLDSTNGTIVNGRRVREHPLADGDRITLGNSRLTFERRTT